MEAEYIILKSVAKTKEGCFTTKLLNSNSLHQVFTKNYALHSFHYFTITKNYKLFN